MVKQNFSLADAKAVASTGALTEKPKPQFQPPRYSEGFGSVTMDRKWVAFDDNLFYQKADIWDFLGIGATELSLFGIKPSKTVHCKSCNKRAESKPIYYCTTCQGNYSQMPAKSQCPRCSHVVKSGAIYACKKCKSMSTPGYEKMNDGKELRVADIMGRNEALDGFFNDSFSGYSTIYINAFFTTLSFAAAIFSFVAISPWLAAFFALLAGRYFQMWQTSNYFAIAYNKQRPLVSTV